MLDGFRRSRRNINRRRDRLRSGLVIGNKRRGITSPATVKGKTMSAYDDAVALKISSVTFHTARYAVRYMYEELDWQMCDDDRTEILIDMIEYLATIVRNQEKIKARSRR